MKGAIILEHPHMKEAALILLIRVLALMPLRAVRALGRLAGRMSWLMQTRMARTTLTNLQLCFPHKTPTEHEALAKTSLQHTCQTICEAGAVWLWPAADTMALITEVEGLALLQAMKAAGKGVLLIGPHFGNWEMLGLYLAVCGCGPAYELYQAPRSAALDKLIFNGRSRTGAHMVNTDNKGVAELLKALRRGEIVGILPDQVPPESGGEFAPFFGVSALTMTLLSKLQQKTGAGVLLCYAKRTNAGFRLVIREAARGIDSEDLAIALAALNKAVEMAVLDAPEQYQWEYKRFKRQPRGVTPPY